MGKNPVVVYIESDRFYGSDNNPNRDALCYFLRQHCGCVVLSYTYGFSFMKDFARVLKVFQEKDLIAVIVKQEEYENDDQHTTVIEKVRKELSNDLPVVVLPTGVKTRFEGLKDDPYSYAYSYDDPELIELIHAQVIKWRPGTNWLGAHTTGDQAVALRQLEDAYKQNYLNPGDDKMLGNPDSNHQIVAEALRLKLLPSGCLSDEFDNTTKREFSVFASTDLSVYENERRKLKALTEKEREKLLVRLSRDEGYQRLPDNRGVIRVEAGCRQNVNGYAIDPVTLETMITYGFGNHAQAKEQLARRIEVIQRIQYAKDDNKGQRRDRPHWRLLTGLIFSDIDGFSTPFLRLFQILIDDRKIDERNEKAETMKRIAVFIAQQKKFILIDHDGNLIEA